MLTNWNTIQTRVTRLKEINKMEEEGTFEVLPKKEVVLLTKNANALKNSSVVSLICLVFPDVMYIVDPHAEQIAVKEAKTLGIPVCSNG